MKPDVAGADRGDRAPRRSRLRASCSPQGARSSRDEYAWEHTVDDYAELFAGLES